MATQVQLQHVRQALDARDPALVSLLVQLIQQDIAQLESPQPPPPDHAYSFPQFLDEIQSQAFRRKTLEEQRLFRQQRIAELESSDAENPLPDRYRAHEILLELWQANDGFSRDCLLELIAQVPLVYGPWKALKRIFKEAEAKDDTVIFGALAARLDMALDNHNHMVSQRTLGYLCRRAWRYLRRVGETLPSCYVDIATDFLSRYEEPYPSKRSFLNCWVLNHVFFHQTGNYSATKFLFGRYVSGEGYAQRPTSWLKHRAFADAWRRSPRPLFALLQESRSESIRQFAAAALKADFRAALREVEPSWVARLVTVRSGSIDEFVIWILDNVPKFEQAKFRELDLHDAVLQLFQSDSAKAAQFAADYARTHARDLSIDQLMRLVGSRHKAVSSLAIDLLKSHDPREEVGLDGWGRLLEIEKGSKLATEMLKKHFGAKELTPQWFADRLLSDGSTARSFASETLTRLHPLKKLGTGYFTDLLARLDPGSTLHRYAANYIGQQLEKIGPSELNTEAAQRLLVHPLTQHQVVDWIENGQMKPQVLTAEFLKRIAYHPTWEGDPLILEVSAGPFAEHYQFVSSQSEEILDWLGDVRSFAPDELGFEWLMELVQRSEPRYHNFAVQTMSKAFLPADFAPQEPTQTPATQDDKQPDEINVDLDGASFVFTGKLATMTRGEAQNKVTMAGGANSKSVTKKLDYLVIGDEGSPLYGQGRKGSKQLKAEGLINDGAELKVISETAFLQMLAGEKREFSADAVEAGCLCLWEMMTKAEKEDDPLARFARSYIRHHHPEICLKETDRPVDPGAEMPPEFLTFQRVKPLFADNRRTLRSLALELAEYEFARWEPPIEGVVEMCETPHAEVREFVAKALTCEDLPENKRFRLDPDVLTADAVYSFCESRDEQTRALGMKLIDRHPRLQLPEELFRLTESPDSRVRAFVIRTFWSLYRDRGVSDDWKPHYTASKSTVGTKKKPLTDEEIAEKIGAGAPARPPSSPAVASDIEALLRRVLFTLPPGRPPRREKSAADEIVKLRPLPARMAKLNLVETIRDLAIEDSEFAQVVSPVLSDFMYSRGKSEQAACLVAVTRIRAAHGEALQAEAGA